LRVLGIPVRIDPTFFILAVLMGMSSGRGPLLLAVWVAVVLGSVLWHELGHAVAFRAFGCQPSIQLFAMGGLTSAAVPRDMSPRRHLVISLSGPGVGLAVGFLALAFERSGSSLLDGNVAHQAVSDLVFANLAWGLFNLLPILPLDGGSALSAALDSVTGGRGRRPALMVSVVTAAGAGLVAFLYGQPFAGALAIYFCAGSATALKHGPGDEDGGPQDGRSDDAIEAARHAFEDQPGDDTATALARTLVGAGRLDEALEVVRGPHGEALGADSSAVVGRALFAAGRYPEAAAVGEAACRRHPHPTLAYNVAGAWARQGSDEEAMAWLSRAVALGWTDLGLIDSDPNLDRIRARPDFAALRSRLPGAAHQCGLPLSATPEAKDSPV